MVRAPAYSAARTKFEAGATVPEVPTARNRSQSRSAFLASHAASTGRASSNNTTAGRIGAEQAGQPGQVKLEDARSSDCAYWQRVHWDRRSDPCSSTTRV